MIGVDVVSYKASLNLQLTIELFVSPSISVIDDDIQPLAVYVLTFASQRGTGNMVVPLAFEKKKKENGKITKISVLGNWFDSEALE